MPRPQPDNDTQFSTSYIHPTQFHELEDFFERNQKELGIHVLKKSTESEVAQTMSGSEEIIFETTEFSDGSKIKVAVRSIPKDDKDENSPRSHQYSWDMSNVRSEKQAREVLNKVFSPILASELKLTPAGKGIELKRHGPEKWRSLEHDVMRDLLKSQENKFKEKGILFYKYDGEMMFDFRPESEATLSETSKRKPKPWDVPKGAPDLVKKK